MRSPGWQTSHTDNEERHLQCQQQIPEIEFYGRRKGSPPTKTLLEGLFELALSQTQGSKKEKATGKQPVASNLFVQ
jgi:hypothetical protein